MTDNTNSSNIQDPGNGPKRAVEPTDDVTEEAMLDDRVAETTEGVRTERRSEPTTAELRDAGELGGATDATLVDDAGKLDELAAPDAVAAPGAVDKAGPAIKTPTKRMGRMRVYAKRFFRNWAAVLGLILMLILIIGAIVIPPFAKATWGWTYNSMDYLNMSTGPNETHWFGTTDTGGDVFTQVGHGLRRSLVIALSVSAMTTVIAAVVGATAAYLGGVGEKIILWIIHFLMVIPGFLILALVANKVGGHWMWLIFALTILGWMGSARVIWSLSMSIREREFVTASRYMGVNGLVSVIRHIIPNIGSLLVLQFAFGLVAAVNSETGLAFLGFGIKPPDVSLGSLLGEGSNNVSSMPWLFFFPAGTLTMLTFGMAFIADGLRDALDPNSAAGGKA